jgi:asparagine synthase (glutamine-hydrolysing)
MCGIVGQLRWATDASPEFDVEAGLTAMQHRGPDDRGVYVDTRARIGMVRLAILDLAGGHQPLSIDNGRAVIVFNGELYNHAALRRELQRAGRVFRTASDTEVILHAVDAWGTAALRRFNGMFAFCVWWPGERRGLIARDGLGEKPLYLRHLDGGIAFASELKALRAAEPWPIEVDRAGLANYLRFGHSVAPATMVAGVTKLLPGHCIVIGPQGARDERWFSWETVEGVPEVPRTRAGISFDATTGVVRSLLEDAVGMRMLADVPVGAFLSGGVDSSTIVALMARQSTSRVKTFSIGFSDDAYDESADARAVADALGTEHHELRVEHVDLVKTLEELAWHYDEPFADSAGFPLLLLSRFARQSVKVVLAGDGGDEVFGGYRRYVAEQAAPVWQRLPGRLTRGLDALAGHTRRARRFRRILHALPIVDGADRMAAWLEVMGATEVEQLTTSSWRPPPGHDPVDSMRRAWAATDARAARDHVSRALATDLAVWLPDTYTEKTDKATMAASIEARLPLLDPRLAAFMARLPGSMKVRGRETKRLLRAAARGLVPEVVLQRPKRGFAVPTDPWFRGPLRSWAKERLLGPGARLHAFVDRARIAALWHEHESGQAVRDEALWTLLCLEVWLDAQVAAVQDRSVS